MSETLEKEILELGKEVFTAVQGASNLFDYTGKMLEWSMKDEQVKISMFRFIDVLASLEDSASVIRHVQEYMEPLSGKIPSFLAQGLKIKPEGLPAKLAASVIRKQVKSVAERFIVGESPKDALKPLRNLRKEGLAFTVDLLGEEALSESESADYQKRYLELVETLSSEIPKWRESAPLIEGHLGEKTAVNISVKLSSLYSQAKPVASEKSTYILSERFAEILSLAKKNNVFVYLDMEDSSLTSITIKTFQNVLGSKEFKDFENAGIVLQAYMRRTEDDLNSLISWAKTERSVPFAVRLVKGAYWDTETILCKQKGWPIPVWQVKESSDAVYEKLTHTLLQNTAQIYPAFGSHNIRSLCHAICAAKHYGISNKQFELQMLYGMAEPIKKTFSERGFLCRDYAPIGELLPGMSYFVRRLLENTSNEGFLRQSFHDHESPEVLLKKPKFHPEDTGEEHIRNRPNEIFANIAHRDFSFEHVRNSFKQETQKIAQASPETIKPVIAGKEIDSSQSVHMHAPENKSLELAEVFYASKEHASHALESLNKFFPTWRDTDVNIRAGIIQQAAKIMDSKRDALSALIVLETAKQWQEADADVAEAIDFLNYYASEAIKLSYGKQLGNLPGETNHYFYEPRGVTVVIGPWNFPLAIPCGMLSAALVTGNCAVLKPAEQSSLVAKKLFDILLEAGLPTDAVSFLPGNGEEIGPVLVEDIRVSTIAFTGSKSVGLEIIKKSAETKAGAEHVKRVIAEMGGKNAIIIDAGADLDVAVNGVIYSAFGYQGQKCSACSRVIVHQSCYQKFLKRLKDAVESIDVGPASDPANFVSPVIDDEAFKRISEIISKCKEDCNLLAEGKEPPANVKANYIRPTVFADIPEGHSILSQEVFGPVLVVLKTDSFEEAIEIANDSEYALTGAVFSRSPKNIEKAVKNFKVGNLYINRSSTGALVMRQPFGGAKMSGVGSKAGGPDYLLQFLIPRVVTENTMRRGFAPE